MRIDSMGVVGGESAGHSLIQNFEESVAAIRSCLLTCTSTLRVVLRRIPPPAAPDADAALSLLLLFISFDRLRSRRHAQLRCCTARS
eukprot:6211288-Pleurochrysis_carterae.AAC.1